MPRHDYRCDACGHLLEDVVRTIDEGATGRLPDCPDLLTSLLGFESQHASGESVSVLIHLAVSMRAHGRGGSMLVVPSNTETWRESVVHPVLYALVPPFSALAELMQDGAAENPDRRRVDALRPGGFTVIGSFDLHVLEVVVKSPVLFR